MGIDIKSKKEFDEFVDKHLNKWVGQFTLMLLKKSNWDLTFEEFIRFSMFKMDCHEEIKGLYKDMKETATEFSDENFTEDDVAHDLFLYLKESFSSKTQEFFGELEKSIAKA